MIATVLKFNLSNTYKGRRPKRYERSHPGWETIGTVKFQMGRLPFKGRLDPTLYKIIEEPGIS